MKTFRLTVEKKITFETKVDVEAEDIGEAMLKAVVEAKNPKFKWIEKKKQGHVEIHVTKLWTKREKK